jgi:hypothetical protein
VNRDWYAVVERVNGHDMVSLAEELRQSGTQWKWTIRAWLTPQS